MKNHSIPAVNGSGPAAAINPTATQNAEIVVILDRSGSMEAIAPDAIASAARLSIPVTDAEGFAATRKGTRVGFTRLSTRVSEKRGHYTGRLTWSCTLAECLPLPGPAGHACGFTLSRFRPVEDALAGEHGQYVRKPARSSKVRGPVDGFTGIDSGLPD